MMLDFFFKFMWYTHISVLKYIINFTFLSLSSYTSLELLKSEWMFNNLPSADKVIITYKFKQERVKSRSLKSRKVWEYLKKWESGKKNVLQFIIVHMSLISIPVFSSEHFLLLNVSQSEIVSGDFKSVIYVFFHILLSKWVIQVRVQNLQIQTQMCGV
jgi:hypothetical protein